jgi:hypothetical protein
MTNGVEGGRYLSLELLSKSQPTKINNTAGESEVMTPPALTAQSAARDHTATSSSTTTLALAPVPQAGRHMQMLQSPSK